MSTFRRSGVAVAIALAAAVTFPTFAPATESAAAGTGRVVGNVIAAGLSEWDRLATVSMQRVTPTSPYTAIGSPIETMIDRSTGEFSLTVPAGTYKMRVLYSGTLNLLSDPGGPQEFPGSFYLYVIEDGGIRSFGRALFPGSKISGTLTAAGEPISAATIDVTPVGAFLFTPPRVVIDLATGDYVIDRLEPRSYTFRFNGGNGWSSLSSPPMPFTFLGPDVTDYDVDLVRLGVVSGAVTIPAPYTEVLVSLWQRNSPVRSQMVGSGPFQITDVASGTYTVSFGSGERNDLRDEWWSGSRDRRSASTIVVSPGQTVTGIDAVMEIAPDITGEIRRTGFDSQNTLVSGISVSILKETPADSGNFEIYETQYTPITAAYTVPNVEPGRYIVRANEDKSRFLRTTYWPGTQYLAEAGIITIGDDEAANVTADITMAGRTVDVVDRVSGEDRYSTAVAATRKGFADTDAPISVAYIASGQNYPDALSAGPAAVHQNGALLLVLPTSIPSAVEAELQRLKPQKIVIVGGVLAVGSAVEQQLRNLDHAPDVIRLEGESRYETSRMVASYAWATSPVAFLATGGNFPDALSAGPAAATVDAPLILIDGTATEIDEPTAALLTRLRTGETVVVGGPNVVTDALFDDLFTYAPSVTRISGGSRYETASSVVLAYFTDSALAFVATGENFPDALAGGALAGRVGAPLYLTPQNCLLTEVYVDLFYIDTRELYLLGGSAALSAAIEVPELCE